MAPRILLIGASGNIGASVLDSLVAAHPGLPIDALVRSEKDGNDLKEMYHARVNPVQGALEDLLLLEKKASQVDIVINCAPDVPYGEGLGALLKGLAASKSSSPKFFIQTSGGSRVWDAPDGFTPGRVWDDIADFDALPSSATHAATDTQVLSASSHTLHTAVVSPSFVVGKSPSKTHPAPIIFPYLFKTVLALGGLFVSGEGKNVTTFVDNSVLAQLYVALVSDALRIMNGGEVDNEVWGSRAYYFAASLEVSFRELVEDYLLPSMKRCGIEMWHKSGRVKEVAQDELTQEVLGNLDEKSLQGLWSRHIAEGFGTAMRIRPSRARKYLGVDMTNKGLPTLDDAVRATVGEISKA